jgi:hypothetical protein
LASMVFIGPALGWVGRPLLAFVGLRWPALGLCWPSLAYVAVVGLGWSSYISNKRINKEKKTYLGPNDVSRHLGPSRWSPLAYLSPRWLTLAFVGQRWPSLAFVGPALAGTGFRRSTLACVGWRWPSLAGVGLRWFMLASRRVAGGGGGLGCMLVSRKRVRVRQNAWLVGRNGCQWVEKGCWW